MFIFCFQKVSHASRAKDNRLSAVCELEHLWQWWAGDRYSS